MPLWRLATPMAGGVGREVTHPGPGVKAHLTSVAGLAAPNLAQAVVTVVRHDAQDQSSVQVATLQTRRSVHRVSPMSLPDKLPGIRGHRICALNMSFVNGSLFLALLYYSSPQVVERSTHILVLAR